MIIKNYYLPLNFDRFFGFKLKNTNIYDSYRVCVGDFKKDKGKQSDVSRVVTV